MCEAHETAHRSHRHSRHRLHAPFVTIWMLLVNVFPVCDVSAEEFAWMARLESLTFTPYSHGRGGVVTDQEMKAWEPWKNDTGTRETEGP